MGEGKRTMRRSVKAEEASPGLELRVMITPADCISKLDCSNSAGFDTSVRHLQLIIFTLLFLHNVQSFL